MTERKTKSRKPILVFAFVVVLCGAAVGAWTSADAMRGWFRPARVARAENFETPPSPPRGQTPAPTLSVERQQGAPLRVTLRGYDAQRSEFTLDVLNVSGKAVRAYTISKTVTGGAGRARGAAVNDLSLTDSSLRPGQQITDGVLLAPDEAVSSVGVSLDYVEFADDTTWGADKYQTAELLTGKRAGVREAARHFVALLEAEGAQAVTDALRTGASKPTPPAGRAARWVEGFNVGLNFTVTQLRHVLKSGGIPQVRLELNRLLDRTKGR